MNRRFSLLLMRHDTFYRLYKVTTTESKDDRRPDLVDTRDFTKFTDAQEEVVNARIYEGIHFRFADEAARKQGRLVAQWAHGHFLRPIAE